MGRLTEDVVGVMSSDICKIGRICRSVRRVSINGKNTSYRLSRDLALLILYGITSMKVNGIMWSRSVPISQVRTKGKKDKVSLLRSFMQGRSANSKSPAQQMRTEGR